MLQAVLQPFVWVWYRLIPKVCRPPAAALKEPCELYELQHFLTLIVRTPDGRTLRVLTDQANAENANFRSPVPLAQGLPVQVELLLRADILVRMHARVEYCLKSERGYLGALSLQPSQEEAGWINAYLAFLAARAR